MSYQPSASLLHGFAYQAAECYGKPHFLCRYAGKAVNSHELFEDATCMCCGRRATNAHHWPPRGKSPLFTLHGKTLKPALFAVCGSGTTGCHDGWHGGARFKALWKWDSERFAREWWEGSMMEELGPHSQALYGFGCWEAYDLRDGRIWQVRL